MLFNDATAIKTEGKAKRKAIRDATLAEQKEKDDLSCAGKEWKRRTNAVIQGKGKVDEPKGKGKGGGGGGGNTSGSKSVLRSVIIEPQEGLNFSCDVQATDMVWQVKEKIHNVRGIQPEDQRLEYSPVFSTTFVLEDQHPLLFYHICGSKKFLLNLFWNGRKGKSKRQWEQKAICLLPLPMARGKSKGIVEEPKGIIKGKGKDKTDSQAML